MYESTYRKYLLRTGKFIDSIRGYHELGARGEGEVVI